MLANPGKHADPTATRSISIKAGQEYLVTFNAITPISQTAILNPLIVRYISCVFLTLVVT